MKKTILVVDDFESNLAVAQEALEEDYTVITVVSGEDALESMNNTVPDLILLDIDMPGMDGFATLENLKAHKNYKGGVPVIYITAMHDEDMEFKGRMLGAVDFITKPFCAVTLRERIELHLK
ncbi:MAG: response regulator [Defluviitaleaceae bacterium]|nr:response regulator [Defluviitaleaceae bacterium]